VSSERHDEPETCAQFRSHGQMWAKIGIDMEEMKAALLACQENNKA
jgi:hypothetical protein